MGLNLLRGPRALLLCAVVLHHSLVYAGPTEKESVDGPSPEETRNFIRDTLLGCGTWVARKNPEEEIVGEHKQSITESITFLYRQVDWRATSLDIKRRRVHQTLREGVRDDQTFTSEATNGAEKTSHFDLAKMTPDVTVKVISEYREPHYKLTIRCSQGACVDSKRHRLVDWPGHSETPETFYYTRTGPEGPIQDLEVDSEIIINPSSLDLTLEVCNEQAAQSLAKAFTHAIKKAGGKKPLF